MKTRITGLCSLSGHCFLLGLCAAVFLEGCHPVPPPAPGRWIPDQIVRFGNQFAEVWRWQGSGRPPIQRSRAPIHWHQGRDTETMIDNAHSVVRADKGGWFVVFHASVPSRPGLVLDPVEFLPPVELVLETKVLGGNVSIPAWFY